MIFNLFFFTYLKVLSISIFFTTAIASSSCTSKPIYIISLIDFTSTMPKRACRPHDSLSSDDEDFNTRQKLARMKAKNKRAKKERRRGKKSACETKRRSAKKSRGKKNDGKIESSISDTADVVMEDAEVNVVQPEWFSSEVGGACDNCCRHHIENAGDCYMFRMCNVSPSELKDMRTPLMTVTYNKCNEDKCITLCESCHTFCHR
jgi:hypothetical protein